MNVIETKDRSYYESNEERRQERNEAENGVEKVEEIRKRKRRDKEKKEYEILKAMAMKITIFRLWRRGVW